MTPQSWMICCLKLCDFYPKIQNLKVGRRVIWKNNFFFPRMSFACNCELICEVILILTRLIWNRVSLISSTATTMITKSITNYLLWIMSRITFLMVQKQASFRGKMSSSTIRILTTNILKSTYHGNKYNTLSKMINLFSKQCLLKC